MPLALAGLLVACSTSQRPNTPVTPTAPATASSLAAPVPAATPVVAAKALVVSAHPEATRIGVVLRRGGNAYDAAVAVHALAVALPVAGNIGGGGFLLVGRLPRNGPGRCLPRHVPR